MNDSEKDLGDCTAAPVIANSRVQAGARSAYRALAEAAVSHSSQPLEKTGAASERETGCDNFTLKTSNCDQLASGYDAADMDIYARGSD